ncbi:transducin family protein [Striga asiatica]|uniref:Transducin family protein n=1 Tax=Striga asiatica TaxID=4170 RepID=A0A5A7NX52_STRAF|nr:transducin family protein [Striga asiatica]
MFPTNLPQVIDVKDEAFIPTCIEAPSSNPILWMVMGASTSQSKDSMPVARVRAISEFSTKNGPLIVLDNHEIPGSEPLLEELQGKISIGEEAFSTAAEAVKTALRNLLIKKQYSTERRELRKKGRNDKKNQMIDDDIMINALLRLTFTRSFKTSSRQFNHKIKT